MSCMAWDSMSNHVTARLGLLACDQRKLIRLCRVLRILTNRRGHLLHTRGRLFETRCLLLRALTQTGVTL